VRALADAGRLDEAAAGCEALLQGGGAGAEVFYLMALVCDARGETARAVACYRKAIYLQPRHEEALEHLALLLSREGDEAGARILRNRARRSEVQR
jgi:chemotaxis protein methyltransferase WspC